MISEDYKQRLLESIEKIGVSYAEHKLLKDEIRRLHNREEKYKEFMFQDQEQKLENINRMYNKVELKEHQEECLSRACACRGFSEAEGYAVPKTECGYHERLRDKQEKEIKESNRLMEWYYEECIRLGTEHTKIETALEKTIIRQNNEIRALMEELAAERARPKAEVDD